MSKGKGEKNPFDYGRKFKNESNEAGAFPVKNPHVLKGIRESIKGMEKGKAQQPRFKAWGQGMDFDAMKRAQEDKG